MAGYRQIHTKIWKDEWFIELEADEKLLFIYLFSNDEASMAGIYKLPIGVMASAGTYVLATSTKPNHIDLTGREFNEYLERDGIPDELATRRKEGLLEKPAKERYSKHVKALVQVGATPGATYSTVLGNPAEIVPLENPYALRVGGSLRVRLLYNGQPSPNQYVQYGGRTTSEGRIEQKGIRGDANGVVSIPITQAGTWYVKFIHMRRLTNDPEQATHESTWASLAFGVK